VHVWIVPLTRSEAELERLHSALSAEERERAGTSPLAPRKRRYVSRQGALREILSRYAGVAPAELELVRSERGKPSLAGARGPRFSISDSGELALVAVAEREVGVDLERIVARRARPRIERRLLGGERGEGLERFYERWTRLEACAKARGDGVWVTGGHIGLACRPLRVAKGYAAAVAAAGEWQMQVRRHRVG
jgi:4'-phosphopantetheinyl transferase